MTPIHVPKHIHILTALLALLSIAVTCTLIFMPQAALPFIRLDDAGMTYLRFMWAARQGALAGIFALAFVKKMAPMYVSAYTFFLIMNCADAGIGLVQGDAGLFGGALVMCVISSSVLLHLRRMV